MTLKLTICASVLLLAPVPQDEKKPPKPAAKPQAEAAQPKQTDKPEQAEKKGKDDLDLLPIETNIIKYTNAQRAKYGLPALKIDKNLMASARQHGAWMARHRKMVHTRRNVAENIAMGYRTSDSAVRGWMNSKGHRANILNRGYQRIGVGAYRTASGTIYWCQQFRR